MSEQVIIRGPGEGRTMLVGGGDYVTYKATSAETDGAYFCFEVATTPGFFRALASTINELRLNNIDPDSIRTAGPSGQDLANLLQHFGRNLSPSQTARAGHAEGRLSHDGRGFRHV